MAKYTWGCASYFRIARKGACHPVRNDGQYRAEGAALEHKREKLLNKHTKSIINQILRDPILKVKELAADADSEEKLALFMQIFDIEEVAGRQMIKTVESDQRSILLRRLNQKRALPHL